MTWNNYSWGSAPEEVPELPAEKFAEPQPVSVFVALDGDDVGGVFATLEDAMKAFPKCSVDEYVIGQSDRIRGYTEMGELWWRDGRDIRWDS